ncbi:uncharacterized protein LOC134246543 [Saccostrea cucullata]|uniref:uncharacterized protein LOC134246543 n=1 Tax=Saccostrea cuccullata TaxID=36930 RepID=UPI002ED40FBF
MFMFALVSWNDVIVKIRGLSDDGIKLTNGSKHLSLSVNISNDFIDFDLTWNQKLQTNTPIYTTNSKGIVKIQRIQQSKEVRFYQDVRNGASLMIMSNNSYLCMTGIFLYRKSEFILEPELEDCLQVNDRDKKYKITEVERSHASFADALKPTGLDQGGRIHGIKSRINRRRRQIDHYKIELFFIIDYSIYSYWYTQSKASSVTSKDEGAKESIRQFYSFVINGMDVRYKNIQTSSYTISILFSGIYIADNASKSTFTENNKISSVSGTQVDSNVALTAVTSWLQETSGLPQNDHAMMFTRYDFTKDGSSDVAGLAWLGAVCTTKSVSVAEDHFDFNVITTAAHELGHGLSAEHDGSNNACSGNDAYIMAATSVPVDNQNPWKFSICSTNYFTSFIDKLNRENNNCMTVLSPEYNPDALKHYTALPGEIFDADAHCRHIVGSGSSFCKGLYNQNFTSICTKLWCRKTDGSGLCVSTVGGDGLQCGNKKWCIAGVCKSDECAPPGDESCLYGDREGKVIEFNGNNVTCSFEDIKKYPFLCYDINTQCCRQCQNFYTGITGCEYGDRTSGCLSIHCPNNPDVCCGTCYNGPAITTPSEEPTTQRYRNPCRTTVKLTTTEQTTSVSSKTTQAPLTTTKETITTVQTSSKSSTTISSSLITTVASSATTKNIESQITTRSQSSTAHTATPSTAMETTTIQKVNLPGGILEKYRDYIIYAGIAAFVLVCLFITCICCLHKKRNQTRKKVMKTQRHRFTNQAIRFAATEQKGLRNNHKDSRF